MFSWSHLIGGLIATTIGVALLKYNFKLVNATGRQDWIEDYLGSGSTYLVYQIMAIILTIGGLLYATGLGTPILQWLLQPFAGLFRGLQKQ